MDIFFFNLFFQQYFSLISCNSLPYQYKFSPLSLFVTQLPLWILHLSSELRQNSSMISLLGWATHGNFNRNISGLAPCTYSVNPNPSAQASWEHFTWYSSAVFLHFLSLRTWRCFHRNPFPISLFEHKPLESIPCALWGYLMCICMNFSMILLRFLSSTKCFLDILNN